MDSSTLSTPLPLLAREVVYVGIDIGKSKHLAGLVSTTLLARHRRFEQCPSFAFSQSREGFCDLLDQLATYTRLEQVVVLVENTGHYHRPLVEFLLERQIPVYIVHVQRRASRMLKSDKRDALALANSLYNQVEKAIQVADKHSLAHRVIPATSAAQTLHSLVRHRYELVVEITRRKNKLTALSDELFPELASVCKNPNLPRVLVLREHYPTPERLAEASVVQILAACGESALPQAKVAALRTKAETSVGTREAGRLGGLVFEQAQLIAELRLLETHLGRVEAEMETVVEHSREGQILRSLPMIGPILAAVLIAAIGHIDNFQGAANLKSYLGWAPRSSQTGTSLDASALSRSGLRTTRQGLYLAALNAVRLDTEWKALYDRLVPLKCRYDERLGRYRGRIKVVGRIAGQIVEMIYRLLKSDAALLAQTPAGEEPPAPKLYDRAIHQRHRQGNYQPAIAPERALRKASVLPFPKP